MTIISIACYGLLYLVMDVEWLLLSALLMLLQLQLKDRKPKTQLSRPSILYLHLPASTTRYGPVVTRSGDSAVQQQQHIFSTTTPPITATVLPSIIHSTNPSGSKRNICSPYNDKKPPKGSSRKTSAGTRDSTVQPASEPPARAGSYLSHIPSAGGRISLSLRLWKFCTYEI
ncbi:hypothetical protein CI102_8563 [Trichoderma harzianum]|nr:hypothetical protein CI102_8563 [Trichoderma harzianum]